MENKLALIPISEIKEMAVAACKSGLFQLPSQEATLTLMLLCQAEGLHPIQALRQYHIIKGRPAMRADAMQAAFMNAGGKIEWRERSDKKATAVFSHSQGGSLEVTWTIEQAREAGLTSNSTWQKYPRAMLSARVVSEGCRAVLPAVVCGLYTPEEVSDFEEPAATKRTSKAKASPAPLDGTVVDAEIVPAVTEKPQDKPQTLAEKCGFNNAVPVEPEVSPEPEPKAEEPKPNTMPAAQVAQEIKQVRALAQQFGCKTQQDFAELMQTITGEKISSATQLTDNTQRAAVINWLTTAVSEEQKEQKEAA